MILNGYIGLKSWILRNLNSQPLRHFVYIPIKFQLFFPFVNNQTIVALEKRKKNKILQVDRQRFSISLLTIFAIHLIIRPFNFKWLTTHINSIITLTELHKFFCTVIISVYFGTLASPGKEKILHEHEKILM